MEVSGVIGALSSTFAVFPHEDNANPRAHREIIVIFFIKD
jgi:hypothetical protein